MPGTDDPSAPFGSTELARLRELIALLVATRTQRLDGFYDREPAARCAANFMNRFMPDPAEPRNKNNRAKSLLLSTELSTGTAFRNAAYFTTPLVLRGQIARKNAVAVGDVDNNGV